METEIEQEECDAKWNGSGFGVWGLGSRLGVGNMKQTNIGNMKCVGKWDQEWGYGQISTNDKAADNGPNQAGLGDCKRLHARSEAWPEFGR